MKLLYNERCFLGIVKFFDVKKGFGYIASNNCGMPSPKYYQDFYVDRTSFIDEKAKKESIIIVFQVTKQDDGRKKAINVRLITNSEDDIKLVLSYYGEYEKVEYKDGKIINLYSQIDKPRELVADLVLSRIVNDKERSPERTCSHFKFFVEHYKENSYASNFKNYYIFDRDYKRKERKAWEKLIKVFTDDECIAILNLYPSICQYIKKQEIVKKWLFSILKDNSNPQVTKIIDNLTKYKYISDSLDNEITILCDNSRTKIKENVFLTQLNEYKNNLWWTEYKLDSLLQSYNAIGPNKDIYINALQEANNIVVNNLIHKNEYSEVVKLLSKLTFMKDGYIEDQICNVYPIIKRHLLDDILVSKYWDINNFFCSFNNLTILFNEEQNNEIKEEAISIMINEESLDFLSACSSPSYNWMSTDNALHIVEKIVTKWDYEKMRKYLLNSNKLFNGNSRFADIIFSRSIEIALELKLSSSPNEERTFECDDSYCLPYVWEHDHYLFLRGIKQYIISDESKRLWSDYINSRTPDEVILLYRHEVISDISESVILYIVNSLTLDYAYEDYSHWYNRPSLKDQTYIKIFKESSHNLFPLITERLLFLDLSINSNIPLAVFLLEILDLKKPTEKDYVTLQNWEKTLEENLKEFRKRINLNDKLAVLLWAVYFKTSGPLKSLSEVFIYLPPYLQIRCVKKLFQGIATNKITYTAETLYNLLNPKKKNICFPLDITFRYLKLREQNPTKSFTNNLMLELLNKRENNDYNEWIGIRDLVAKCNGRTILNDGYAHRVFPNYYNGTVELKEKEIVITIPIKMVDSVGILQKYNNKYYSQIKELIMISFDKNEYYVENRSDKSIYHFGKYKNDLEIINLARYYNLNNDIFQSISFTKNEIDEDIFCECRLTKKLDKRNLSFYWCGNKPCYRTPIRYRTSAEWEHYTILDFMRILGIPTDYINKDGEIIKYGYYIFFSSFLKSFAKFYEHLKCRECGKLLKPIEEISNYESRVVNTFQCMNDECSNEEIVYLNHCFNKTKCKTIIDSRETNLCPNGQYICPKCGACCSTENFQIRLDNLHLNGGIIKDGLVSFVNNKMGHWEKNQFFCYKCGKEMKNNDGVFRCSDCKTEYNHQ